ncbi:hypothetical protein BX616_004596, partial [Lobosporangium transversale]
SDFDLNDYSSDALDSEPEAEHEPPPSSIHPLSYPGTAGTDSSESPEPSEGTDANVNEITTKLLSSQLHDYQWIKSTVDDTTIKEIVNETRTNQYDYLPRVFYVDKEDFSTWLERDGRDHFFVWVMRKHYDNKPGGRSRFSYVETYECHHGHETRTENGPQKVSQGSPQIISQDPGQESREKKKRRVLKPSQKAGCTAKLIVHNMKDDSEDPEYATKGGRKQLRITYYFRHTGHTLGDVNDFQYLTMTESTKARIRNLIRLGLCTRGIIAKINLTGPQAYSLHKQGRLQRDHVLTYEDVYKIHHKYMCKLTKLSDNDMDSMRLWMSKLQQEKQFTVFTKSCL